MTLTESEAAWADLIRRGQEHGYAPALEAVLAEQRHRTLEELARHFASHPGTWTGLEVADCLRRWEWR